MPQKDRLSCTRGCSRQQVGARGLAGFFEVEAAAADECGGVVPQCSDD